MNWYYALGDATKNFVGQVLQTTCNVHQGITEPSTSPGPAQDKDSVERVEQQQTSTKHACSPLPASGMESEEEIVAGSFQQQRKQQKRTHQHENPEYPFPEPPERDRPSEYLRAHCPLCFGGKNPDKTTLRPHSLVSVDACFQQKHNKQTRDPPHHHTSSFFIDEDLIATMEEYVNTVRPPRPAKERTTSSTADENDQYEHAELKVPRSVLNGCNNSFIAADEAQEKASTQFFDVTGLIALICCHDHVLWILNMTSPGKKQHYVFALLEMLFQNVPRWCTFGFLYDIACQTH